MGVYQALLFDLFETCVLFDTSRLPSMPHKGREIPSTTPLLMPLLADIAPEVTLAALHGALREAWIAVRAESSIQHEEVPSPRRFEYALNRLGLPPEHTSNLALSLAQTHTRLVCGAAYLPESHRIALEALGEVYPLALVSNFDYAPSCRGLLEREGLDGLFQAVVISEAIGLRKPHPRPFTDALEALKVSPEDTLFIGDSAEADVAGAAALGCDVAWINPRGRELPAGVPSPRFDIPALPALLPLLGIKSP